MKKPTIRDIAKEAEVSPASVSMILNGKSLSRFSQETVSRVYEASRRLGYKPRRQEKGGRRKAILIICPSLPNPYYASLVQGMEQEAKSQGYTTIIYTTYWDKAEERAAQAAETIRGVKAAGVTPVLLTGDWLFRLVEDFFHLEQAVLPWEWQWFRFLLLFLMMFLFVLVVYRMAAPRGKPRPPVLTGAFLAAAALVAASALFSWFIGLSSRYSLVYGSLASVIILLVWLYLCGNILILGNVFNCVWYRKKKVKALRQSREWRS